MRLRHVSSVRSGTQLPMAFIPLSLVLACFASWLLIAYAASALLR